MLSTFYTFGKVLEFVKALNCLPRPECDLQAGFLFLNKPACFYSDFFYLMLLTVKLSTI
jgi:hypothetical protein